MAGQTADRLGRKFTIQIGSIIAIVGCALQTAAVNEAMLIVGRLIAGWSIGVLSMIVPVYQVSDSPGFRTASLLRSSIRPKSRPHTLEVFFLDGRR